ncbi:hypothetical protein NDU88_004430 [Pleurodeles waltl]|uniref:Uncharacterized protein n=1 Tax=Pleurodeles waltl TaxID=8319 RepID=A0AAV7V3J4_PLEWA|nr:hypothetical protein NDU88_004430 [Pleurodeles waltl]
MTRMAVDLHLAWASGRLHAPPAHRELCQEQDPLGPLLGPVYRNPQKKGGCTPRPEGNSPFPIRMKSQASISFLGLSMGKAASEVLGPAIPAGQDQFKKHKEPGPSLRICLIYKVLMRPCDNLNMTLDLI